MFGFFQNSVGVANVRKFEKLLAEKPRYVTTAAAGAGFSELAAASSCSEIATLLSRADYDEVRAD